MSVLFYSYDERPELEPLRYPVLESWPAFMLEDPVGERCRGLLYERFGAFQHFLWDEEHEEVVAEANSVPMRVDLEDLPERGWEDVLERGTAADEEPNAVTAISVAIRPDRLGQGLSRLCLERMRAMSRPRTASSIWSRPCGPLGRRAIRSSPSSATRAGRRAKVSRSIRGFERTHVSAPGSFVRAASR